MVLRFVSTYLCCSAVRYHHRPVLLTPFTPLCPIPHYTIPSPKHTFLLLPHHSHRCQQCLNLSVNTFGCCTLDWGWGSEDPSYQCSPTLGCSLWRSDRIEDPDHSDTRTACRAVLGNELAAFLTCCLTYSGPLV